MSSLTVSLSEQVSQWDTGLRAENLPFHKISNTLQKIAMHGIVSLTNESSVDDDFLSILILGSLSGGYFPYKMSLMKNWKS